jgi:hypothetical protein
MGFETWIDKQIREAAERGEFADLPGAGKPIPGQGQPDDELWWLKDYVRREGLSTEAMLPTSLRLRKEVERLAETVRPLRSERAVREVVDKLNARIADWLRAPSGPQVHLLPVDADEVVARWLEDRPQATTAHEPAPAESHPRRRRFTWWRRRPRPTEPS